MLMKDHHERDTLISTTIHEHVSFIKIQEGYPQFMYKCTQMQNQLKYQPKSERIGLLDFYEGFSVMPRVLAAICGAVKEVEEGHRPDNGLLSTCLELSTVRFLAKELKMVQAEQAGTAPRPEGISHIEDDDIMGVSDKMLFYSKELKSSAEDENCAHNPFVIGKLDSETLKHFNFDAFQGYIG